MNKLNKWTTTVEEDPETGDSIITLPEDLLSEVQWKEGDTITWIDNKDGTLSLKKKIDSPTEETV